MRRKQAKVIMCSRVAVMVLLAVGLVSCFPVPNNPMVDEPVPGPDKQASGTMYGAVLGAGSGAVTGFQLGLGTGPGAAIGAGFGAAYGLLSGLGLDLLEENQISRDLEKKRLRELSWVQEVLLEHYQRRLELHPNRDIFPADLFFEGDSSKLRPEAELLLSELARLTKERMPWSRLVVASYTTAADLGSQFAASLNGKRAEEVGLQFVHAGVESRRVLVKAVTLEEPIVVDPYDHPDRFRQAIELIALDY